MNWELAVIIGLFFLFVIAKGISDEINRKKEIIRRVQMSFGKPPKREENIERMKYVSAYLESLPKRESDLDEITWNDLDMDRLFWTLNGTYSAVGEEYLWAALHRPETEPGELEKREDRIQYFSEHKEEREAFAKEFLAMGKLRRISVYKYLMRLSDVPAESNVKHYIPLVLYVVAIGIGIFGSFGHDDFVVPSIFMMILTALYNVITYMKRKGEIEPYLNVLGYTVGWLRSIQTLSKVNSHEDMKELQKLSQPFRGMQRGMRLLAPKTATGGLLDMLLDYVRILTHIDLIKFNRMYRTITEHTSEIHEMFTICGRLDMAIAIASYRKWAPITCVPQLRYEKDRVEASKMKITAIGHPLISEPVRNDLTTEKPVLLTGSNASGKSTFLRSIALGAIMAQTVHTVCAESYSAGCYHILSSMSLSDDLLAGESYYIVEIKAIKRILDQREGTLPVLCFVDEVLRGTNTAERIGASTEILRYMANAHFAAFAATHDLELTTLLEKEYDNYHFSETVSDGDIRFDYLLKDGRATSKNAIALLRVMEYPDVILNEAMVAVQHFLDTGEWAKR